MANYGNTHKEQGLASIIVATILMVILSLITLGFTRIMQREQRQSLDKILSSQAFYAAESGVNDVYSRIATTAETTDCLGGLPNGGVLDASEPNVRYTCVFLDKTPTDIVYNNSAISSAQSKIVPVEATATVNSIKFEWSGTAQNPTLPNAAPNCTNLPVSTSWGTRPPLLKLDLAQASGLPAPFTREQLISATYNIYLAPALSGSCGSTSSQSAAVHTGEANKGQVVPVACTAGATYHCTYTLTGLSATRYIARIRPIYGTADRVRITAQNSGSPATDLELIGAQAIIDSTGRANDVVRRIQVRVPLTSEYPLPEFVIQAMDGVCKQVSYAPPSTVTYNTGGSGCPL